jgi:BlaI family transcriptional regulator, penicillinase repressor
MSEKAFIRPTEAELEILQILWAHGLSSVKFLNEALNQKRVVGYTSTLKTIQIMHEKGLVKRQRGFWKSHDYEAAVNQAEVQSQLLNEFVANTFGGSMTKLMMQALGNQANEVSDLSEIKAFIQEMENKNR